MNKRLFIATKIKLETKTYQTIYQIQRTLAKEKIKWVELSNIHLTLKFLGDTDTEIIPKITEKLEEIALSFSPTLLQMHSIGIFPHLKRPRVLWIGLDDNQKIVELANIIDDYMIDLGFEAEKREFKPHITIGRIKFLKNIRLMKDIINQYKDIIFQQVPIQEFILYESILRPQGPMYKAIAKFKLLKT